MRTLNSLKNFSTGIATTLINTLLNFISRTIFISILGSSYLGVNGLLSNLLSMLSLAELGIGSAINFSLYKPIAEKDNKKIAILMNLYKKAYRIIGLFVFISGLIMMLFLDVLIKNPGNVENLRLIFLIYVINTSSSYFITYKVTLINADQKEYKLVFINIAFNIATHILQITSLLVSKNYIIYLLTNMLVLFIQRVYVNQKVTKLYPLLNQKVNDKLPKNELKIIIKNVKAMIVQKIGDYCINGTDNIIISSFISVAIVGVYSNYAMIISMVNTFIMMFFNSITASMGNLIATEDDDKKLDVFEKLNFIGFWIYGIASICLYNLLNPFIELWLGEEFLISQSILAVVILNYYLTGMRAPVNVVKSSAGLYDEDKFVPIIQSIVNLVVSIILVQKLGLVGVFIGTLASSLIFPCWYRPYIIYKFVFKKSTKDYYKAYILYLTIIMFSNLIVSKLINMLFNNINVVSFISMILICLVLPNTIFIIIFYKSKEFKYIQSIIKNIAEGILCRGKRKLV